MNLIDKLIQIDLVILAILGTAIIALHTSEFIAKIRGKK